MTRALLGLFALAWVATAIGIVGVAPVLAVLGTLALFALPGLAWSRTAVGALASIAAMAVVHAGVVALVGWNVGLAALGLLLLTALAALARRRFGGRRTVRLPAPDRTDRRFLLVVALLLLAFVALPLARNPSIEGDNHTYHSLMAHDYLMRGTFAVGVRHGLPPRDAFLASERLDNSCLYYSIVAFAMEASGGTLPPERFVAATDLVLPFLFLLALFAACRVVLPGRWPWVAVLLGVLAYSFNDLFVLTKYVRWSGIDRLHDFAAEFSDLSHGWTRDFLVEPHAVLALTFGITAVALSLHALRTRSERHPVVPLALLLVGAFASDGFLGTLFVLFVALSYPVRWLRHRDAPYVPGPGAWIRLGGLFAVLAGVALLTGLASAGTRTGGLTPRPYMTAIRFGVALFPLVLGPALLFALLLPFRRPREPAEIGWGALWGLAGLCLLTALFVQHTDPDFADLVLRKSMKVMRLPVVLLGTAGLAWWLRPTLPDAARRRRLVVVAGLTLLAAPTFLVDLATLGGLHDRVRTSSVSTAELRAAAWLRANTSKDAVVQSLPENRDGYYPLSPVAMFGGRAMALGNLKMARLSSASPEAFAALAADVERLFASFDADTAWAVMRDRGIDYVLVGPRERVAYGYGTLVFDANPSRFERVYDADGIAIYGRR